MELVHVPSAKFQNRRRMLLLPLARILPSGLNVSVVTASESYPQPAAPGPEVSSASRSAGVDEGGTYALEGVLDDAGCELDDLDVLAARRCQREFIP